MDYRENAGYIITDSCHVGDSEFVLGVHLTAPQQFVTWKCSNRTDYDWGHYFSDLFSAQKDLVARAQEEVQCLEKQRQNSVGQEATMLAGSMFGWQTSAADPRNYDEQGQPIKPRQKDRGEAR